MVTVKLISSTDLWNSSDNVGIAGKYMFAVSGLEQSNSLVPIRYSYVAHSIPHLNNPAIDAIITIPHFSLIL